MSWIVMPILGPKVEKQVVVDALVVDDDPEMRTAMTELLDGAGFAVAWAGNGAEVFELIRAGVRPRVLLLDMQMPVLDGWSFLERRRKYRFLRSIPVVLTTALDRVQLVPDDVVAFVQKPVDPDRLVDVVRRHARTDRKEPPTRQSHSYYLNALVGSH
jgi:CheY-like chemotaxis protein